MKLVEEDAGMEMGPGTIYGSIQRLRDAGWVQAAAVEAGEEAGGRRGRAFELTDEGRVALRAEVVRIRRLASHATVERFVSDAAT
jgi:DNA-binding PadR family transcriptional regulator